MARIPAVTHTAQEVPVPLYIIRKVTQGCGAFIPIQVIWINPDTVLSLWPAAPVPSYEGDFPSCFSLHVSAFYTPSSWLTSPL